jgi:hypothetical protein
MSSLLIALDDTFGSHDGVVGILACIATRAPLTQQIPTLVECDFDFPKVCDLLLGRRRPGVRSLQRVLVLDELADPVNNLDLVHAVSFHGVAIAFLHQN